MPALSEQRVGPSRIATSIRLGRPFTRAILRGRRSHVPVASSTGCAVVLNVCPFRGSRLLYSSVWSPVAGQDPARMVKHRVKRTCYLRSLYDGRRDRLAALG